MIGLVLGSGDRVKAEILETVAQWNLLNFAFPYDRGFLEMYNAQNVVPTGLEVAWYRIFIAIPRLRSGVPATLTFIPRELAGGNSPHLQVRF